MATDEQRRVEELNKSVVLQVLESFNTGDSSVIPRLLHPDMLDTVEPTHGVIEEIARINPPDRLPLEIRNAGEAFPDRHYEVDQIIAEGDTVILRWTMTGTHLGPLFGRPPTGRRIKTFGYEIVRLRDGLMVAHGDDGGVTVLDVLRQLDWLDEEMLRRLGLK
jgi:hypothetical protein